MAKYPEHEKLKAKSAEASTLSGFIDFVAEQGWELATFDDEGQSLFPVRLRPDEIIGMFLEINPTKIEKEKQAMLDEIRTANKDGKSQ